MKNGVFYFGFAQGAERLQLRPVQGSEISRQVLKGMVASMELTLRNGARRIQSAAIWAATERGLRV